PACLNSSTLLKTRYSLVRPWFPIAAERGRARRWGGVPMAERAGLGGLGTELLGPFMGPIKILGHTPITRRGSQQSPIGRLVNGATEQLPIHETFQRQKRMTMLRLPILREPIQAKFHRPGA